MKSRNAGYRIAGIAGLILVAAAATIGAILLLIVHVGLARSLDAQIADELDRLVAVRQHDGRAAFLEAMQDERESRVDHLGYALFDRAGRRIAGDLEIARPAIGWSDAASFDPIEGYDPARVLTRAFSNGEVLSVASGSRPVREMNGLVLWQFAVSMIVIVILAGLMAVLLGRYLQGRLQRITETANAIIAGDMTRRVEPSHNGDEFDRIAESLNAMLDRIAALVAGLRRVSSNVAHDLKTPLTRLRARIEQTLIQHHETSTHRDALEYALEQTDEVLRMFDAVLRIAEIEEGSRGPHCERFNLLHLVDQITQALMPVFEAEKRILTVHLDPELRPCGDRELLGMALINLLENVLRHTPAETGAHVTAISANDGIHLTVADHGPGISETEHAKMFKRFFRSDVTPTAGGHGLGLSLVAAVMSAHGGRATASDNFPGLAVELILPERCV